jgi:hypothetical protein
MDALVLKSFKTRRGEAHQKAKRFYEELIVLEELQTKAVLRMKANH